MARHLKSSICCTIITLLTFGISASAQEQDVDYGIWATAGVNVSPVKGLKFTVEGEFGTYDYSSKTDEYRGGLMVDYKICKYLTANTGYVFIYLNPISTPSHRWLIGATGHLPLGITRFDLRERYQETYVVGYGTPDRRLRNRLQFTVNIPHSMFSPFVHVEPHISFNSGYLWDVIQCRYAVGTKISMGRHDLSVFWWGIQYMKAEASLNLMNYLAMSYYFTIK